MRNKHELPIALLVLPPGGLRNTLVPYLASLKLAVAAVDSCREVRDCLHANRHVDIVITQVSLRDGNWCDVLSCVVSSGVDARVVVSSGNADERFWSEVLWRGVYDILVEPYDRTELRRIVDGALRAAGHDPIPAVPFTAGSNSGWPARDSHREGRTQGQVPLARQR